MGRGWEGGRRGPLFVEIWEVGKISKAARCDELVVLSSRTDRREGAPMCYDGAGGILCHVDCRFPISPTAELSSPATFRRSRLSVGVPEGADGHNAYSWTRATRRSSRRSIRRQFSNISPAAELIAPANFCRPRLVGGVLGGGDCRNAYSWSDCV